MRRRRPRGIGAGWRRRRSGRRDRGWPARPRHRRDRPVAWRPASGRRCVAAADAGRSPGPHVTAPLPTRGLGPADRRPGDAAGRQSRRAGGAVDHPPAGPLRCLDQQSRPGGPAPGEPDRAVGRGRRGGSPLPHDAQSHRLGRLPADHADPAQYLRQHQPGRRRWCRAPRRLLPLRPELHPLLGPAADRAGASDHTPLSDRQGRLRAAAVDRAPGRADDPGPDLPLLPDGGLPPREVPPGPAARRLQRPPGRVAPAPARGRPGAGQPRRPGAGAGREPGGRARRSRPRGRIT